MLASCLQRLTWSGRIALGLSALVPLTLALPWYERGPNARMGHDFDGLAPFIALVCAFAAALLYLRAKEEAIAATFAFLALAFAGGSVGTVQESASDPKLGVILGSGVGAAATLLGFAMLASLASVAHALYAKRKANAMRVSAPRP